MTVERERQFRIALGVIAAFVLVRLLPLAKAEAPSADFVADQLSAEVRSAFPQATVTHDQGADALKVTQPGGKKAFLALAEARRICGTSEARCRSYLDGLVRRIPQMFAAPDERVSMEALTLTLWPESRIEGAMKMLRDSLDAGTSA